MATIANSALDKVATEQKIMGMRDAAIAQVNAAISNGTASDPQTNTNIIRSIRLGCTLAINKGSVEYAQKAIDTNLARINLASEGSGGGSESNTAPSIANQAISMCNAEANALNAVLADGTITSAQASDYQAKLVSARDESINANDITALNNAIGECEAFISNARASKSSDTNGSTQQSSESSENKPVEQQQAKEQTESEYELFLQQLEWFSKNARDQIAASDLTDNEKAAYYSQLDKAHNVSIEEKTTEALSSACDAVLSNLAARTGKDYTNASGTSIGAPDGAKPDGTVDSSRVGNLNSEDIDRTKALEQVSKDVDTQYQVDYEYLNSLYATNQITNPEYQTRIDALAAAKTKGTYMEDRKALIGSLIKKEEPKPTDGTNPDGSANNGTGIGSNGAASNTVNVDDYITTYQFGGRLLFFNHNDGTNDDDKVGYIKLLDNGGLMSTIAAGENKQNMDAIYSAIKSRYNRFIIQSVQESRSERSSILPTVGDSFAATFSGREPMVISVQGLLICDNTTTKMTWYHAFMNAYEFYLRASKLAKYRVKMKLVLPDFTDYTGYILTVGTTMSSDSDMVIPMNFSMLVVHEAFNKAYGINGSNETSDIVATPTASEPAKEEAKDTAKDAPTAKDDTQTAAGKNLSEDKATNVGEKAKDPSVVGASKAPLTADSAAALVNKEVAKVAKSSVVGSVSQAKSGWDNIISSAKSIQSQISKVNSTVSRAKGVASSIQSLGKRITGGIKI